MKRKDFLKLQLFAEEPAETPDFQKQEPDKPGAGKEQGAEGQDPKNGAKYTDEDVDRLINRKFAEWQKKKDAELDEAKRLAGMNAQEKAEHERDQMKRELDELKRQNTIAEMSKVARKMLAEEEINIPDELLGHLVTVDADDTKGAVKAFAKLFKDSVQSAVKEALKGEPPKTGSGKGSLTKEQIMKVQNRTERQRLINENIELFKGEN